MEFRFFIFFGSFFMVSVIIMIIVSHQLLKNADKRLEMASAMVMKLSSSCDKLATVNTDMTAHVKHLQDMYEEKLREAVTSRDSMMESYKALLRRYTSLEDKLLSDYEKVQEASFNTIRGLAERPTFHNENRATDLG